MPVDDELHFSSYRNASRQGAAAKRQRRRLMPDPYMKVKEKWKICKPSAVDESTTRRRLKSSITLSKIPGIVFLSI